MVSAQDTAITTAHEAGNRIEVWLGPARGDLDESAIVAGWLPGPEGTPPDWAERTGDVLLSAGVTLQHDGTGYEATFTVADESRLVWADDLAVAFVARHWDGAAWAPRYLVCWGYLDGADNQRRGLDGAQTGQRKVTYAGYWSKIGLPAHRFGRPNLAQGASIGAHTPELANPLAEAPLEYVSQADVKAERMVDGNGDTVYVAATVADPAQPALGDSATPRFTRVYAGRATRQRGDGGEPIAVEIGAGHTLTWWGDFEGGAGSIPGAAFPGGAFIGDHGSRGVASLVAGAGYGGSTCLRFRAPANSNVSAGTGWQWEIFDGGYAKRPVRLRYRIKASGPGDVGRLVHFRAGPHYQDGGTPVDYPITLANDWQTYEHTFDSSGNHGGLVMTWKADFFQLGSDLSWDIDDLRLSVGYSSNAANVPVWIAADDGAGHEQWWNLGLLMHPGGTEVTVPADDTIVVCDDAAVYRQRFGDSGGRTVVELKRVMPWFYLNPGVGRVKLVAGPAPANFLDYDSSAGGQTILDEFVGSQYTGVAGGNAMRRDNPLLTGAWVQESPPQVGLAAGAIGAAYVCVDLGAYQAPHLIDDLPASGTGSDRLAVSDLDQYAWAGYVQVGAEQVWYHGKDDTGLIVLQRGFNGTAAAPHSAGDPVTPLYDGNAAPGPALQTGPLWDYAEVRRKPGTPRILAGALLWSNLAAPGDPSVGGALWEQHPDWHLLARWNWAGMPSVIGVQPPAAPVFGGAMPVRQARWLCLQIVQMERYAGSPQHAKANELVVRAYVPGSGPGDAGDGAWRGHGAGDLGAILGHLLVMHGGVPGAKVAPAAAQRPVNDLPVAPTTVAQALGTLAQSGLLRLWCDPANTVTIAPDPASPDYDGTAVVWTWDAKNSIGELAAEWAAAHAVAQVVVTAKEAAGLRALTARYPSVPARLGEVKQVSDAVARSAWDAQAMARARFRADNARRIFTIGAGACPWLRPYQRHLVNYPDLDLGDGTNGINTYVAGWSVRLGVDPAGGVSWDTTITLKELAL